VNGKQLILLYIPKSEFHLYGPVLKQFAEGKSRKRRDLDRSAWSFKKVWRGRSANIAVAKLFNKLAKSIMGKAINSSIGRGSMTSSYFLWFFVLRSDRYGRFSGSYDRNDGYDVFLGWNCSCDEFCSWNHYH